MPYRLRISEPSNNADEDEERVSRHAPSNEPANLVGRVACHAEEDKSPTRAD
mgnify:CR=1 FL=1